MNWKSKFYQKIKRSFTHSFFPRMDDPVIIEGSLLVNGVDVGIRRGWKRWYFVLRSDLEYYESQASFEDDEYPVGTISLGAYHVSVPNDIKRSEFIIHGYSPVSPYFMTIRYPTSVRLCADDRQTRDKWVTALNQTVETIPIPDGFFMFPWAQFCSPFVL